MTTDTHFMRRRPLAPVTPQRVLKQVLSLTAAAWLLASVACSSTPLAPAASVSTPTAQAPASGAQIANSAQPVTLVVQNATVTQSATAVTYNFEVAADAAFATKVQTKPGVAAGSGGQTSITLDPLPASASYYWHAQAIAGGTTGPFSATANFTIGSAITINAPAAVAPANGSTVINPPTLTVANAMRTGPVGVLAYRFDISTNADFSTLTTQGSVGEGAGQQTSFTPGSPLANGVKFYWRATAIDQINLVTSPASATATFTTIQFPGVAAGIAARLGILLWPGAVPTGVNGHAFLGNNCNGSPNWAIATCHSPTAGVDFQSPTIEMLRVFDLLDRGYDPQSAINWMFNNGFPTSAAWYPYPKFVIGFPFVYISARDGNFGTGGIWDVQISLGLREW
jgi:hypothetical protein